MTTPLTKPEKKDSYSPVPGKAGTASLPEVHENKKAYRSYMEIIEQLDDICKSIAAGVNVKARLIDDLTGGLLQAIREHRQRFIGFILGGEIEGFEAAKSLVNTAILSAYIAMELKLLNHQVFQVVTGALLHDVGMLRMPKEIIQKSGDLSAAELKRIQEHPLQTYNIVTREMAHPENVGMIVLQHHERWDGEGYPRRVAGKAIVVGARIVSVADAFEAMVSKKPYRNSMIGYQAMKNLLSDNMRRFDPDIVKVFIQTMGIYPIGSVVVLNNGALARVISVAANAPLRPMIKILVRGSGMAANHTEGNEINLLTEKTLFITRAIDPKEAVTPH